MKAVFQFLLFTVVTFVCMSWLAIKTVSLYNVCMDLRQKQQEQQWLVHQCQRSHDEMSKYADCDSAYRLANMSVWHEIQKLDHVQSFLIFPALVCCLLWLLLYGKILYK